MSSDQAFVKKIVDDITVSATFVSDPFDAEWIDVLSFEMAWSAGDGITGDFTIETSVSGLNFIPLDDTQFQPPIPMPVSGASGFHIRDLPKTGLTKFRIRFTLTGAGSMILNAWIGAKNG